MKPIRLFISSVQKELELERAAVAALVSTDPFLFQHCVPVLFDKEPPPPRPAKKGEVPATSSPSAMNNVPIIYRRFVTIDRSGEEFAARSERGRLVSYGLRSSA